MIIILFSLALVSVIVATSIDALRSLAMVFMAAAFIIGTVIIGRNLLGSYKRLGKCFISGVKDVLPSIVIIMIAFGITHIAQQGNILHTIFYYFYNSVTNISPYVAVIILYVFVLIVEFFIPSASAKAVLIYLCLRLRLSKELVRRSLFSRICLLMGILTFYILLAVRYSWD